MKFAKHDFKIFLVELKRAKGRCKRKLNFPDKIYTTLCRDIRRLTSSNTLMIVVLLTFFVRAYQPMRKRGDKIHYIVDVKIDAKDP